MTDISILIDVDGLGQTLGVDDVWPDGNAPGTVTAEAVKTVMESCGSKRRVLDDWCLLDYLTVTVTVPNPRRGQLRVDGSEEPAFTTAEVWGR